MPPLIYAGHSTYFTPKQDLDIQCWCIKVPRCTRSHANKFSEKVWQLHQLLLVEEHMTQTLGFRQMDIRTCLEPQRSKTKHIGTICFHKDDLRYKDFLSLITAIKITGYNHSVTGCGSQQRHVVVTQRILI